MLEAVLLALKVLILILLYLFIWRVARAATHDLGGTKGAGAAPPPSPVSQVEWSPLGEELPPGAGRLPDEHDHGESRAVAEPRPRLIVERSSALAPGTELVLHGLVTVGRSEDNHVVLDDAYASTTHARIVPGAAVPGGAHYVIEDLGSTNGTFVNEERVSEAVLRPGARVRIGETVLRYEE